MLTKNSISPTTTKSPTKPFSQTETISQKNSCHQKILSTVFIYFQLILKKFYHFAMALQLAHAKRFCVFSNWDLLLDNFCCVRATQLGRQDFEIKQSVSDVEWGIANSTVWFWGGGL